MYLPPLISLTTVTSESPATSTLSLLSSADRKGNHLSPERLRFPHIELFVGRLTTGVEWRVGIASASPRPTPERNDGLGGPFPFQDVGFPGALPLTHHRLALEATRGQRTRWGSTAPSRRGCVWGQAPWHSGFFCVEDGSITDILPPCYNHQLSLWRFLYYFNILCNKHLGVCRIFESLCHLPDNNIMLCLVLPMHQW